MENNNNKKKSSNIFSIIKNVFIIFILLQFIPGVISQLKKAFTEYTTPKTHVGQINIAGIISDSSFYVKKIKNFLKNDDIKALLVRIESPGGIPGSCQAIYEELKKFNDKKPVVALVENVCASGAYYVASAATKIISPASSLIGSIGVYLQLPNVKKLLEKWDIKFKFIQSGKFKTAGSPFQDLTIEDEEYFQNLANENYNQFIKDVANSRKLNLNSHKTWADGKIFLATQAQKLNLIDEIGSQTDAENLIKEIANIDTDIKLVKARKKRTIWSMLTQEQDDDDQDFGMSAKFADFLYQTYLNLINKGSITSL